MAALGSLVVSLEANTAKFTSDMGKAAYQTEQAMKQMSRDAKIVGAAMGVMAVAAGGALGVMVKSSLDAMDNMSKLAQKTGTTTETISALAYAAGLSGVSTDALGGAIIKLSKNMSDATQGTGDAIKGFKALSISVTGSDGAMKSSDAIIGELAGKFATFEDSAEKTALAVNIFGKSGADLIPLLNSGADGIKVMTDEAARMGLVMDTETAKAAEKFNDDMSRLQQTQTAFANSITTAVLPVLQAVADEMLGAAQQSDGFSVAASAARTVLETFVVLGSEVAFVFKGVGTEIGGMAAQLAALASGDLKGFTAISAAMKEDAARARVEHDKFIAGIMDRTPTVTASGAPVLPKANAPRIASGKVASAPKLTDAQKIEQDAQRFVAKLKEQADTFGMSGVAVLEYQMNLSKFPQVYKDEAIALQQRIDAYKAAADEDKAFAEATERFMADRERDIQANEANVDRIRIALMTEAEQQQLAHEIVLEELQTFHDAKFENIALANLLIEEENARHQQVLSDMQAAHDLQSLGMMGNATDQLLGIMKRSGQEQTALGKAVFLASKAIAVAEILINTEVAAAKAGAQLGIFGIPMAMMIRATGYASAGMVAGMAIADASAEGGYDIPSGTNPVTQLHEREMVLPKEQADVIRGLASNGGSGGGPMALTIVNQTSGRIDKVTEQRISPTERAIIIQEAVNSTAAQLSDPNSKTSRAMSRNYATQRSR